jgi:hypothetical protein
MPVGQAIDEILLAVDCLTPEESRNLVRFFPCEEDLSHDLPRAAARRP